MDTAINLPGTLPGRFYADQDIFEEEQRRIFASEWVLAAHVAEVADPGDVLCRSVAGEQLLLVRDVNRELHAFFNVCRHRGSKLCLGDGNVGRRLTCPYHSWSYHLDGRLAGVPTLGRICDDDALRYGLREVALEQWCGTIWVSLANEPAPLVEQLGPQIGYRFGDDTERVQRYHVEDLVVGASREYSVAANWKVILENFQECYHCSAIHPELVEQIPVFGSPRTLASIEGYAVNGYEFAPGRPGFSISGTKTLPPLPGLGADDGGRYFGMILQPNAALSLTPDHAILHRFEPLCSGRTQVVCDWLFPSEVVNAPGFNPGDAVELFHRVNLQDFGAAEWCQPNMASKAYEKGGYLVALESEIIGKWFYGWYMRCMKLGR